MFIHLDRAVACELDAGVLEPQALEVRSPAGGAEHRVHFHATAVREFRLQAAGDPAQGRDVDLEAQVHT
jgi:hypothetical protein